MALDPDRPYKPLDFGNGLIAGSVNDQGRLVTLNTSHPEQGYVTLSCLPRFPEDRWYDQPYVRRYRAALASRDVAGFGFTFRGMLHHPGRASFEAGAAPRVTLDLDHGVEAGLISFVPTTADRPLAGTVQICHLVNRRDTPYTVAYEWGGPLGLIRASYAQLTEGGPLPRPDDTWSVHRDAGPLIVENTGLGAAVAVIGLPDAPLVVDRASDPPGVRVASTITLAPGARLRLVVVLGFGPDAAAASVSAEALARQDADLLLRQTLARYHLLGDLVGGLDAARLVRRALVYILACCAVPVGASTCLITDHQLLPLAWTRDAYYQVQALLAVRRHAAAEHELRLALADLVRRHLLWLFEVAERPDGYWGRAYLTTGRCKDLAFQLDQQCYPLLQLVDYLRETGDEALVERLRPRVAAVLGVILDRRAPGAWLFPTSETPADDVVEYPYHLSSQVLAWRTLHSLAELNARLPFTELNLAAMAEQVRQDVYRHMVVDHAGGRLFCYLTDLAGGFRLYHDANDLPTVLAPLWGFCSAGDPVWRATIDFAFNAENQGGYYPGPYGGLGSVHSPHPWPLGDVQELLVARLLGDEPRRERAWSRLERVACWDGMLPEAYDAGTGAVASRHWFSWPGAALAMVALERNMPPP